MIVEIHFTNLFTNHDTYIVVSTILQTLVQRGVCSIGKEVII